MSFSRPLWQALTIIFLPGRVLRTGLLHGMLLFFGIA
jgi:hypothetical protein